VPKRVRNLLLDMHALLFSSPSERLAGPYQPRCGKIAELIEA